MNAEVNELSVVYYKKKRKQNKDGSPYVSPRQTVYIAYWIKQTTKPVALLK